MPQSKPIPKESVDDFYESMPATADQFFSADTPAEYDGEPEQPGLDEIKITAVITIAFVMLVALGLALVLFGGLELMRSVRP